MKVKLNFPKDNSHIHNLAFVRALLIRDTIESLKITYQEKEHLRKSILDYLEKN